MFLEAPKRAAITISRINPRRRLHKTARPTILVALVLTRFSSGFGMSKKEQQVASEAQARSVSA